MLSEVEWDQYQDMDYDDLAKVLKGHLTIYDFVPDPVPVDESLKKCIDEQSGTTGVDPDFDLDWTNGLTDCLTSLSFDVQIALFGERAIMQSDYNEKVKKYLADRIIGKGWDDVDEIFFVVKGHL